MFLIFIVISQQDNELTPQKVLVQTYKDTKSRKIENTRRKEKSLYNVGHRSDNRLQTGLLQPKVWYSRKVFPGYGKEPERE
jgi:hypothetical protein